jgi:hypothetical protein
MLYFLKHLMMIHPHVVAKLNVVAPDTFKVDLHVVMLFNRVGPETVYVTDGYVVCVSISQDAFELTAFF